MLSTITTAFALVSAATAAAVSITPHQQFSSSVGVLGCKINTNRVAYWPMQPGCDSVCVKVTANGRSVNLLHIDTSGGAFDVSYDAWNYLSTGKNATAAPTTGGGIPANWEKAPMSACADLITAPGGKLPLMAAHSMNYYTSCRKGTWVRDNAALWNIQNSACTLGLNEQCKLDLAVSNQPACPHQLGTQTRLHGQPVYDIVYGTGKEVLVTQ
ncbi:hypothetical protein K469DRAFT_715201 [Zopfia rhizophila CBS 207.26]|uniref:Lytic polysaccharide monooxygenase n=1 Tax=Zopfia rhizophila CBS 207.26 TaxID=1314779 RepID=A0A6A6ETE2_9PEZI|nr:hypothetical protein K469DRAFT_715201 [Zopfia rhizophila CBS 207.26]